eukprot:scaffold79607_cov26-Tisochrysis_lutea.AAC.3
MSAGTRPASTKSGGQTDSGKSAAHAVQGHRRTTAGGSFPGVLPLRQSPGGHQCKLRCTSCHQGCSATPGACC